VGIVDGGSTMWQAVIASGLPTLLATTGDWYTFGTIDAGDATPQGETDTSTGVSVYPTSRTIRQFGNDDTPILYHRWSKWQSFTPSGGAAASTDYFGSNQMPPWGPITLAGAGEVVNVKSGWFVKGWLAVVRGTGLEFQ
jgi:hypothetical protein